MQYNHLPKPCVQFPQHQDLEEDGDGDWLLTYADMMTLILTFFVLMFSIMDIKQTKFEEVNQSISENLLHKTVVNPLIDLYDGLSGVFDSYQINPVENLSLTDNILTISLPEDVLFSTASIELSENSKKLIQALALKIKGGNLDNYTIEIEGHTDDRPIRTARFPSNWELSSARAIAVLQLFLQVGIDNNRLKAIGYGESRPKVPNRNEAGAPLTQHQKRNRRVEIVISVK